MSQLYFQANIAKIRETILYISAQIQNPTLHTVFKIMYFADKLHLERFGRFITGDTYIAMEFGPVPSHAYDLTKEARESERWHDMAIEGYCIIPLRDANIDFFSDSDIQCIDEAISTHKHKTFGQLTDESHDAAWQSTPQNEPITIESIVRTFSDADDLLAHLNNPHPNVNTNAR